MFVCNFLHGSDHMTTHAAIIFLFFSKMSPLILGVFLGPHTQYCTRTLLILLTRSSLNNRINKIVISNPPARGSNDGIGSEVTAYNQKYHRKRNYHRPGGHEDGELLKRGKVEGRRCASSALRLQAMELWQWSLVLSCPTCHVPSTERTAAAFDHLIPLFEAFHRSCSEPIPQKEAETITEFSEVSLHKAFQA